MPSWNCCVKKCQNNTHGPLRFFSFPKDEERRQLWAESCGRRNWFPTDLSRICEVHFDKSQFEQNQQDGIKLLKWSAIPRMFEEWTQSTSLVEEFSRKSYANKYLEEEAENVALPENEEILEAELTKNERSKRKRNELDDEEYLPYNKDKNGSYLSAKKVRNTLMELEKTEELEDELSRIKANIKRLMKDDDDNEKPEFPGWKLLSPTYMSILNRQSNFKGLNTSSQTVRSLSTPKQGTQSIAHRPQPGNQSKKTSEIRTNQNSNSTRLCKESQPSKLLQMTEDTTKVAASKVRPQKKQILSNVSPEKLKLTRNENIVLQDIFDDMPLDPKIKSSEKPWRPPDELFQIMRKEISNKTQRKLKHPTEAKNTLPKIIQVRSLNSQNDVAETKMPSRNGELQNRNPSIENKNLLKSTTVKKVIVPRIIQIQNVGLANKLRRTGTAQSGSLQSSATNRIVEVKNGNTSKDNATVITTPVRIVERENSSSTIETPRIEEQENGASKDVAVVNDTLSETTEIQSKTSSETVEKSSKLQNETALIKALENNSNVPVRPGIKTYGNVASQPESKSAHLKKLLASMRTLEDDMFAEGSNLQIFEEEKNTNAKEKLEVEVQTDDYQPEEIDILKAELMQLSQQLEEKDKTIEQLKQSLAAILPPGQCIMLQSENNENIVIYNQQEVSS